MKIENLNKEDYGDFFHRYLEPLPKDTHLLNLLKDGKNGTLSLFGTLPEGKLHYKYAEGKWTPKEILRHLIDTERIMAYRALRFAREDKNELQGFDENKYVQTSLANEIDISDLLNEYQQVRDSTISLFKNLSSDVLSRKGVANGKEISVRALGFIISGHELHHLKIIKERYI